jgi:hypothetical protein
MPWRIVCEKWYSAGDLDLAIAQREIAENWIAAIQEVLPRRPAMGRALRLIGSILLLARCAARVLTRTKPVNFFRINTATFSTELVLTKKQNGVMDPFTLKKLAGHTDLNTTMRYVHLNDSDVRTAMEKAQGRHNPGHKTTSTEIDAERVSDVSAYGVKN